MYNNTLVVCEVYLRGGIELKSDPVVLRVQGTYVLHAIGCSATKILNPVLKACPEGGYVYKDIVLLFYVE